MPNNFLYLNLPDGVELDNVCIKYAPINSSGDIYHIVSFIILSRFLHHNIPRIILTYDIDDRSQNSDRPSQIDITAGTQAVRMMNFVRNLGYEENCELREIGNDTNCYQVSQRELLTLTALRQDYDYIIDHRMTTSVISQYFLQHGIRHTNDILREGFNNYRANLDQDNLDGIDRYTDDALLPLMGAKSLQPYVVLHCRYSSTANSKQNAEVNEAIKPIIALLKYKGYKIICIYADSRNPNWAEKQCNKNLSFSDVDVNLRPFQTDTTHDEVGYGKLYHLSLLTRLFEMNKAGQILLKAIIGNTSGTLDLAAFIGHRVMDLHQFSARIDYQGIRILLQSVFMQIFAHATTLQAMFEYDPGLHMDTRGYHIGEFNLPAVLPTNKVTSRLHTTEGKSITQGFVQKLWDGIASVGLSAFENAMYIQVLTQLTPTQANQDLQNQDSILYKFCASLSELISGWTVKSDETQITDPEHLYTDDEIERVINARLGENTNMIIRPANFLANPAEALETHLANLNDGDNLIVPIHMNGNHWTGLFITVTNQQMVGIYVDPLGHRMPEYLYQLLRNVLPIHTLEIVQQTNGIDCGPITVENLVKLAKLFTVPQNKDAEHMLQNLENYLPQAPDLDTAQIRAEHQQILNPNLIAPENQNDITVAELVAEEHLAYTRLMHEEASAFKQIMDEVYIIL